MELGGGMEMAAVRDLREARVPAEAALTGSSPTCAARSATGSRAGRRGLADLEAARSLASRRRPVTPEG